MIEKPARRAGGGVNEGAMGDFYPCSGRRTTGVRVDSHARLRSAATGLAFLSALAASRDAAASGFLGARFGADHGNPVNATPFATYYNPAALIGIGGTKLTLDGSIVYRHASYERSSDALTPGAAGAAGEEYIRANTGKATLNNLLALPFAGVASDFGMKNIAAGFAVYVPFGGLAQWDKNDSFKGSTSAPGAYDGQARWHSISGIILSIYNTASFAVRIPAANLSIGVNASFIYTTLDTVRARNADATDATNTPSGALAEGRSLLSARGAQFGAGIGIVYQPMDTLKLGLSYTARPNFGEMRLKGTLKTKLAAQAGAGEEVKVDVLQTLPDVFRLGVAYNVSKQLELRLDGDFVTWSVFKKQCVVPTGTDCNLGANGAQVAGGAVSQNIPREWKNAFGVRAGAGYLLSEDLEIFGSGMYDSSAVPDQTLDATFIDADKVIGTVGVRKEFSKKVALAASFTHVQFFERDTKGKAAQDQFAAPSRSPSGDGKYNQTFEILNLNGTYTF